MCGINGAIALNKDKIVDSKPDIKATIDAMNETIVHRGPDSDGIYAKGPVAFGFRRLSIIDLDDSANQPMTDPDENIVLVFNGEVYNYIELRQELQAKGHRFKTSSDSEVILKSYLEYGEKCVERFNGMWAIAIYDFRENKLFCSRDRMGVKPFYYTTVDGYLYFSSELKAIHKATGQSRANREQVFQYLAYGYRINDGNTFFDNCFELLPGSNMVVQNGKIKHHKYWTLKNDLYDHKANQDYFKGYEDLFTSAVKLRYRSDVPVAILLSGGLDSTAIARTTDNLIENGELEATQIDAFIASFPGFKDDETAIAQEFIKTCKHINLHEIRIDSQNVVDNFEKMIYDFDHPLGSFNTVAHNSIMQECKNRGFKVVINGQGSDEALAGYDRYISGAFLLDQLFSRKGSFLKEFKALNQKNGYSSKLLISQMIKAMLKPSYAAYLRGKYQEKIIPCLNKEFVRNHKNSFVSDYKFSFKGNNFDKYLLDKINNQGLNTILHYEDVSSMNQSIEIRSPFVDYRLMEYAFSIPNELKLKEGRTKIILRDSIGKSLPKSITENRKKIGFSTPFYDYLFKDETFSNYVKDVFNSKSFKDKEIWDSEAIRKEYDRVSMNQTDVYWKEFPFWRVLNLEVWSKVYNVTGL